MSASAEEIRKRAHTAICLLAAAENLLEMAEREGPHHPHDILYAPLQKMIDQIHKLNQRLLLIHDQAARREAP